MLGAYLVEKNGTLLMNRAFPFDCAVNKEIAAAEARRFAALHVNTDWSVWEQSWVDAEQRGYRIVEFKLERAE